MFGGGFAPAPDSRPPDHHASSDEEWGFWRGPDCPHRRDVRRRKLDHVRRLRVAAESAKEDEPDDARAAASGSVPNQLNDHTCADHAPGQPAAIDRATETGAAPRQFQVGLPGEVGNSTDIAALAREEVVWRLWDMERRLERAACEACGCPGAPGVPWLAAQEEELPARGADAGSFSGQQPADKSGASGGQGSGRIE